MWNYDLLYDFLILKIVHFQNMETVDLNLSHSWEKTSCLPPFSTWKQSFSSMIRPVTYFEKEHSIILFFQQFTLKQKYMSPMLYVSIAKVIISQVLTFTVVTHDMKLVLVFMMLVCIVYINRYTDKNQLGTPGSFSR